VSGCESAHKENDLHAPQPTAPQKLCEIDRLTFHRELGANRDELGRPRHPDSEGPKNPQRIFGVGIGQPIYGARSDVVWLEVGCFPVFDRGISNYYLAGPPLCCSETQIRAACVME
jgi:hypothetical protein